MEWLHCNHAEIAVNLAPVLMLLHIIWQGHNYKPWYLPSHGRWSQSLMYVILNVIFHEGLYISKRISMTKLIMTIQLHGDRPLFEKYIY